MLVLRAIQAAAYLAIAVVGCDRPTATLPVKSTLGPANTASRLNALPTTLTPLPVQRQAVPAAPTVFMSVEQLQAVETMRINHVPEFGYNEQLTIVEESEEERELREQAAAVQAAQEALVAPIDYANEVEEAMEVLLRSLFAKQLASPQKETIYLAICARKPSRKLLQRFVGDSVIFRDADECPASDLSLSIYEIRALKPTGENRAVLALNTFSEGGHQVVWYRLHYKAGKWVVDGIEEHLIICFPARGQPIPGPRRLIK